MSELQMSEIEIGTEILIAISAVGIIAFFLWQLRRLKRESVEQQKKPREPHGANHDRP